MKRLTLLILSLVAPFTALAQKDYTGWHFPVGLTYSAGFKDVTDAALGEVPGADYVNLPVGLSFSPHFAFSNEWSAGADVGPFLYVKVEMRRSGYFGTSSEDSTALLTPLGAYARYDFMTDGSVTPYVRAGVRHCFVTGDLVDGGSTGLYGSIGLALNRTRSLSWGCEMGVDTTKIYVYRYSSLGVLSTRTESAKPYKFTVSAFVNF